MYNPIIATKDQATALYEKHLKCDGVSKIKSSSFSMDDEDDIGFVTLHTTTGKKIFYQFRKDEPCFVEFMGFGNLRYDINYPKLLHQEMYNFLKEYGIEARNNFLNGGEI